MKVGEIMADEYIDRPVYTGWRLYKRVTIIESAYKNASDNNGNEIPKAYIADASDKKQLATGRQWAKTRTYNYETQQYVEKEGKEYEFENEGFTLELSSSPSGSWRGGKLSFCMCIIRKDGYTWQTGISSDLLINLLKQSDCIKGVVQGNIAFARKDGQVGMVLVGSKSYEEALKDAEIRKAASKTSKAIMGHEHYALQVSNTWMFDAYDWTHEAEARVKEACDWGCWRMSDRRIPYLVISDKPVKKHVFPETYRIEKYFKDCGENITTGEILLNEIKDTIKETEAKYKTYYRDYRSVPILEFGYGTRLGVQKFPARSVGKKLFTPTITAEQFAEFRRMCIEYVNDHHENRNKDVVNCFNINSLSCLAGVSLNPDKSELPDVETVRDWVEKFDGNIIVEYFGEVIMSNKLKTALEKKEYFDLKLPKDLED